MPLLAAPLASCAPGQLRHGSWLTGCALTLAHPLPCTCSFSWLLAVLRTQFVLTMQFVSSDVMTGTTPLPSGDAPFWEELVSKLHMGREQLAEAAASYHMACRCKARPTRAG